MDKRLRNLSILVSEYQAHALDVVRFACINPSKEVADEILKKAFVHVFRSMKGGKNMLPIHLLIYEKTISAVKRSKDTPPKQILSVKDLKVDVLIEGFNPNDIKDVDIFNALNKVSPEDRVLLCLSIRHKINYEELATLFNTSTGTIISRLVKGKTAIARGIIEHYNMTASKKSPSVSDSKECFFVKNNALATEQKSKIEKHISKCEACKNFYNWQTKIEKLLEQEQKPTINSSINKDVFKHLSFLSFEKRLLYSIRTKWTARVISIVALVVIILLSLLWLNKKPNKQYGTAQEIKIISNTKQSNSDIKYTVSSLYNKDPKTTNKDLKELIDTYIKERTQENYSDISDDKGYQYKIIMNKEDALRFIQELQEKGNFDIKTSAETNTLGDSNNIRIEIQVNKNGA